MDGNAWIHCLTFLFDDCFEGCPNVEMHGTHIIQAANNTVFKQDKADLWKLDSLPKHIKAKWSCGFLKEMDVHSLKLTASSDPPEKPTTFRCYVSVQWGQFQLTKKLAVQVTAKFEWTFGDQCKRFPNWAKYGMVGFGLLRIWLIQTT